MNPMEDGVTHINIYSKARTELGGFLSNFTYCPITISGVTYASVEAYWYTLWAESGVDEDLATKGVYRNLSAKLRQAYGYSAKVIGKLLVKQVFGESYADFHPAQTESFRKKILAAIKLKLWSHPEYLAAFKESTLPFKHYYYFGSAEKAAVIDTTDHQWLVEGIERLREELKAQG